MHGREGEAQSQRPKSEKLNRDGKERGGEPHIERRTELILFFNLTIHRYKFYNI